MSEFDLPKQCWSLTSSSMKTKKCTQFYILHFNASSANVNNKNTRHSCKMCSELTNKLTWAQSLKKCNPKRGLTLIQIYFF